MIYDFNELLAKHPLPFQLHDMQQEDIQSALTFDRCALFLPVGYGKTVISTTVALAWQEQHRIVLLPPILVNQWVKWLNSIPGSGGAVGYKGTPAQRKEIDLLGNSWWIMSYQIFKNDLPYLTRLLAGRTYTTLVDEAQNLKNTSSKLFTAVESFSAGRHLLLLTGTELNNPGDAYAYIKLKTPTIYRSRGHFENLHVADRDFFNKPSRWAGLDIITQNLYLQSVQRTKEEVHKHLPKANYLANDPYNYDLSPEHKAFYTQLAEEMIVETEQGGKIDGTTPGKLRNALQQIVINWSDFSEDPSHRAAFYDLLDMVCEEIDVMNPRSSKLIVWSWFKLTTRNLTAYLNATYGSKAFAMPAVAAYSEANSVKSVEAFMDDERVRFLVAQPGSAGAGLNPQHICWEAIFAEIPTRSIPFRQSAGRIDREGQKYNPNIRIATARGTVQPGMYADLLDNDGLVQKVQGNEFSLRKLVYG
jgi:hypothetical protein